jgi:calcineurin-like phosphoesterase family protein
MDAELFRRWNSRVNSEDLVIVVGDFIFARHADAEGIVSQLNGQIILVRGGHDKVLPVPWVPYMFMRIAGYNCLINHRPIIPRGTKDPYRDNDSHLSKEIIAQAERVICGHAHQKWLRNGINYNCGVDVHGFAPISLDELEKEFADSERI